MERALRNRRAEDVPDYVDAHNWVFVPASFALMMPELGELGFLDLWVESLTAMPATEFLVRLRPGREAADPGTIQARRRTLMEQGLIELADQARQIGGSPPDRPPDDPAALVRHVRYRLGRWLSAGERSSPP